MLLYYVLSCSIIAIYINSKSQPSSVRSRKAEPVENNGLQPKVRCGGNIFCTRRVEILIEQSDLLQQYALLSYFQSRSGNMS